MGCCQSSANTHDSPEQRPYSPSNPPADSSRHITGAQTPTSVIARAASAGSAPSRPGGAARLSPGDHFNKPLRRHVWTSRRVWTREQLDRDREEFFDTRVTGRPEVWNAIRMAVEIMNSDLDTAQTILDAAGVTLPTGDFINGAYDEIGNFYQIPEQCISDPLNIHKSTSTAGKASSPTSAKAAASPRRHLSDSASNTDSILDDDDNDNDDDEAASLRREEKGKGVLHAADSFTLKARLSDRGGPDVQVAIGTEQTVRALARRVQEEAGLSGRSRIRIAYMGRILKENEPLRAQGWVDGHVVNALVF